MTATHHPDCWRDSAPPHDVCALRAAMHLLAGTPDGQRRAQEWRAVLAEVAVSGWRPPHEAALDEAWQVLEETYGEVAS